VLRCGAWWEFVGISLIESLLLLRAKAFKPYFQPEEPFSEQTLFTCLRTQSNRNIDSSETAMLARSNICPGVQGHLFARSSSSMINGICPLKQFRANKA
jgi:hypothetical protein